MTPFLGSVASFTRKPDAPYVATVALSVFANIIIVWLAVAAAIVTSVSP